MAAAPRVDALVDFLQHSVSDATLREVERLTRRPDDLRPQVPALARQARKGEARVLLTFGGQAMTWLADLASLWQQPEARRVIKACSEAILGELQAVRLHGLHPHGLNLAAWAADPESAPPSAALSASPVSQAGIFVTQAARLAMLGRYGLEPEAIAEWAVAVTGHSQGIMTAALAAEAHAPEALADRAALMARYMVWQGVHMQRAARAARALGQGRAPMVAITGWTENELRSQLPVSGADGLDLQPGVDLSLVNGVRRYVLSGPPAKLEQVVARVERVQAAADKAFAQGQRCAPRSALVEWLGVSVPFHSEAMQSAVPQLQEKARELGLQVDPSSFAVPLLRYEDGEVWQPTDCLSRTQSVGQVDWQATMDSALRLEPSHAVNLGPGSGGAALDAVCLRGRGVRVLSAATEEGRKALGSADSSTIEPPSKWSELAPRVYEGAEGLRLENAFTRSTGRPPIILPGMTPTTVEAPIIAAAANAGYLAELAGGGQATEAIMRQRAEELREALEPGEGYVFNTLYLDPHLWGLHMGRDRLVQRLRAEGHPILGVTISAGLPPVDEAVALLDELAELDMHQNALKVGTPEQVEHVLQVAAKRPDRDLMIHVEGGRAGGHHGYWELEDLLLATYHRIRKHPRVLLCVGGGVSSPQRARDLLDGRWSERHGYAPMPVDCVFIGTAAMACAEAKTSPSVKAALAKARGAERTAPRRGRVGDIVSGRSGLGADIHYLDNHASRTAAMLDSVAGDHEAAQARKIEIVTALSRTAKPYFGDLEEMTYTQLLHRLAGLLAVGRERPYEDGVWLDPTHRALFGDMLRRALRRCGWTEALPQDAELDGTVPDWDSLRATPVLPEDARFFLQLCRRPGRPVTFVPVIDGDVHRWYSRDALWQSHDERWDAEQVLIIPGPAVGGISEADEPVATLLSRFLQPAFDVPSEPAPDFDPVELALDAPRCVFGGTVRSNPLPAVLKAGGERATLKPIEGGVRLRLSHPVPAGANRRLDVDFELRPDRAEVLRAPADFAEVLRGFYRKLMPKRVRFDAERQERYEGIVGHDAESPAPHLLFAAALPAALKPVLEETGADPLRLLHLTSEVRGGGHCSVSSVRRVELEGWRLIPTSGGTILETEAGLYNGKWVGATRDQFLLRDYFAEARESSPSAHETQGGSRGDAPTWLSDAVPLERSRVLPAVVFHAPREMEAFAHASGDLNPIHRDPALAALAGLDDIVVHGQWTTAAACALLADRPIKVARSAFLAPVQPGARLRLEAEVIARLEGDDVIRAQVFADDPSPSARETASLPVLRLDLRRAGASTAVVFPGQGCQRRGMGMAAYTRSAAARAIWQRAEAHTSSTHGFSILEAVRSNPNEMQAGAELLRHPRGVLNLTQITQVALTVVACAGVEELRELGVMPADPFIGGHSVGEYAAIAALSGLLPLESVIDVVYHRGRTMQNYVPRDAEGHSPYGMAVVKPHKVGLDHAGLEALVAELAQVAPIYVVNLNLRDRQYSVAGEHRGLDALRARLNEIADYTVATDAAWVELPGIDVPFHSPLLREGVPAFREVLERCFAEDLDLTPLLDRYLPNLVARPFELSANFVQSMIEVCGPTERLLAAKKAPKQHGRTLLIELLAWQFASPVRWIETQEWIAEQVEQLVEVGPAPVLTNMMKATLRGHDARLGVLHNEADREALIGLGEELIEAVEEAPAAPIAAAPVAAARVAAPAAEMTEAPVRLEEALAAVLARATGRSPQECRDAESLDALLGGNSAKRNQVLMDLGKEFGVGPVDGAHQKPFADLAAALEGAGGARYRHPGPYLRAAQDEALKSLGLRRADADKQLGARFGLPAGRRLAVLTRLVTHGEGLDETAKAYAAEEGLDLSAPTAAAATTSGETAGVDPAGFHHMARAALAAGGLDPTLVDRALAAQPSAELSPTEAPRKGRFEASRHVAFTQSEAWARADALVEFGRLCRGETPRDGALPQSPAGLGFTRAATPGLLVELEHLSKRGDAEVRKAFSALATRARQALAASLPFADDTALITGAGPGSIAEAVTAQLLEGGARVIVTTSNLKPERLARFKRLYRSHAARGAELHVLPFDQGSREDVEALVSWLYEARFEVRGPKRVQTKAPWTPTLCFPFAAAPAEGDPTEIDDWIAHTLEVNLIGVERLVGALARIGGSFGRDIPTVHVVLPLSPNHGQMGRDGLYAEAKAGLEALMNRWRAEHAQWGHRVGLVGARIGWVRGTKLMEGLNGVDALVEARLGISTFSPEEMASMLLARCASEARDAARQGPIRADLDGGLGAAEGLREVIAEAMQQVRPAAPEPQSALGEGSTPLLPRALFAFPDLPAHDPEATQLDPSELIAVVGFGELGPYGTARGRWDHELRGELSLESALELAWLCGCVRFEGARWVDAETGDPVDPADMAERYELAERIGVRMSTIAQESVSWSETRLSEDMSFEVSDRATAESFRAEDPEHTLVLAQEEGFKVIRRAGARVRVPRLTPLNRDIAGRLPEGFDARRLGLDPAEVEDIDPVAIYNLLATTEAFRAAGLPPEELWQAMHPSRIACTQGSGIGGMRALRRLYTDALMDTPRQTDVLQETLINVSAAWPAMRVYGGYGSMVHPVGACATAAVSVEVGCDLLRLDKADFVVAGAFDDIGLEGLRGFGDMNATIPAETRAARGLQPEASSRPFDSRRGGFVEAQGGGTLLLCRADLALKLGLPMHGLIGGAWSCGDGLQRSVPAPGPGLLSIAAGGEISPLGRALKATGLSADDIGVVSMHGTSTEANDTNEAALHAGLAEALGRSAGNPLPVIAQKAVTGHSKGGAAAWQLIGLMQAMAAGEVPPMRNLDEPDGRVLAGPLVFSDQVVPGALKAGLLTSLGFGHVGAALLVLNPEVLLSGLDTKTLRAYAGRRDARWRKAFLAQHAVLLGDRPWFVGQDPVVSGEAERSLLLDPEARISPPAPEA